MVLDYQMGKSQIILKSGYTYLQILETDKI